jgi:hypothetical protein
VNWILDNLQIVIIVASTIAWWLTQRKESDDGDTPPPNPRPGREKIDVEQLERNRRLREEIQRKRQQRQSGQPESVPQRREREGPPVPRRPQMQGPPDGADQIPPVLRELMGMPEPPSAPEPAPPPLPKANPVSARQQRIEKEMAELAAKRREAEALAARVRKGGPPRARRKKPTASSLNDRDFLATLRDASQARRAIVLREILSKPIALR